MQCSLCIIWFVFFCFLFFADLKLENESQASLFLKLFNQRDRIFKWTGAMDVLTYFVYFDICALLFTNFVFFLVRRHHSFCLWYVQVLFLRSGHSSVASSHPKMSWIQHECFWGISEANKKKNNTLNDLICIAAYHLILCPLLFLSLAITQFQITSFSEEHS